MKTFLPIVIVLLVFAMTGHEAFAAKGKPKKGPAPAAAEPNEANPTEALAPYINNVDQLLALRRGNKLPPRQAALLDQASGRMVTLRAGFAAEREKAAEADRGKFDAAMATCDVLTKALNERQAVLGDLRSSKSVQASGKMEEGGRKDNLQQGLKGGGVSKAAGTVVERDREREANAKAEARAAQNEDALNAMAVNRWNKRAIELKTDITNAYARIK